MPAEEDLEFLLFPHHLPSSGITSLSGDGSFYITVGLSLQGFVQLKHTLQPELHPQPGIYTF